MKSANAKTLHDQTADPANNIDKPFQIWFSLDQKEQQFLADAYLLNNLTAAGHIKKNHVSIGQVNAAYYRRLT